MTTTTIIAGHTLVSTSEDTNSISWVCACGQWATVEYKGDQPGHTPMADRFAGHLTQVEDMETGRVMQDLPKHYTVETYHRKSWIPGINGRMVTRAIWYGGWRDLHEVVCYCWMCTK